MASDQPPTTGISVIGRLSRPDHRTNTLSAHTRQDLEYAGNISLCIRQVKKCRLPPNRGGIVLRSPIDGDVTDLLRVLESPDTGRFLFGTTCLALARCDKTVVPNRHHYIVLALHNLRRFALEFNLGQEHFDMMNGLLSEAQKRYESIWGEARASAATNPQSQTILDALGKWRQGKYLLNMYDEEEPISSGSPHRNLAVDHENNQMLSRSASQETLVATSLANSVEVAESLQHTEAERQESQMVGTEPRSINSGVVEEYGILKLEEKGTQVSIVEEEVAEVENVAEPRKRMVHSVEERRPVGLKVRRKALSY